MAITRAPFGGSDLKGELELDAALTVRNKFRDMPRWFFMFTTSNGTTIERELTFMEAINRRNASRPSSTALLIGFEFSSETKDAFCACPHPAAPPGVGISLRTAVLEYERTLVQRALEQAEGSVTRASALLDIEYQTLAEMLKQRHKELKHLRTPLRKRGRKTLD
jgi:hypothetical protein